MVTRQAKFRFEGEEAEFGGIYVMMGSYPEKSKDYIICGCCGSIVPADEAEEIEIYRFWVDISEEIKGGMN